ncbi:hypothetical protein [Flavobacterium frigidarium]|uniref:hypothetical protein n=1 Tax=Flavobacterium frigidarium TaxID=99286 RepID=UPI0030DC5779
MMTIVSLCALPTVTYARDKNPGTTEPKEIPVEVQNKLDRLEEIKEMDKSDLSRVEKKELRKEVRTIKADLKSTGNGVYLSVGAIIIIVLLLILLL